MSDGNPFGSNAEDSDQCAKLQQHLSLLRAEFVKCQAERDTLRYNYSRYRVQDPLRSYRLYSSFYVNLNAFVGSTFDG